MDSSNKSLCISTELNDAVETAELQLISEVKKTFKKRNSQLVVIDSSSESSRKTFGNSTLSSLCAAGFNESSIEDLSQHSDELLENIQMLSLCESSIDNILLSKSSVFSLEDVKHNIEIPLAELISLPSVEPKISYKPALIKRANGKWPNIKDICLENITIDDIGEPFEYASDIKSVLDALSSEDKQCLLSETNNETSLLCWDRLKDTLLDSPILKEKFKDFDMELINKSLICTPKPQQSCSKVKSSTPDSIDLSIEVGKVIQSLENDQRSFVFSSPSFLDLENCSDNFLCSSMRMESKFQNEVENFNGTFCKEVDNFNGAFCKEVDNFNGTFCKKVDNFNGTFCKKVENLNGTYDKVLHSTFTKEDPQPGASSQQKPHNTTFEVPTKETKKENMNKKETEKENMNDTFEVLGNGSFVIEGHCTNLMDMASTALHTILVNTPNKNSSTLGTPTHQRRSLQNTSKTVKTPVSLLRRLSLTSFGCPTNNTNVQVDNDKDVAFKNPIQTNAVNYRMDNDPSAFMLRKPQKRDLERKGPLKATHLSQLTSNSDEELLSGNCNVRAVSTPCEESKLVKKLKLSKDTESRSSVPSLPSFGSVSTIDSDHQSTSDLPSLGTPEVFSRKGNAPKTSTPALEFGVRPPNLGMGDVPTPITAPGPKSLLRKCLQSEHSLCESKSDDDFDLAGCKKLLATQEDQFADHTLPAADEKCVEPTKQTSSPVSLATAPEVEITTQVSADKQSKSEVKSTEKHGSSNINLQEIVGETSKNNTIIRKSSKSSSQAGSRLCASKKDTGISAAVNSRRFSTNIRVSSAKLSAAPVSQLKPVSYSGKTSGGIPVKATSTAVGTSGHGDKKTTCLPRPVRAIPRRASAIPKP